MSNELKQDFVNFCLEYCHGLKALSEKDQNEFFEAAIQPVQTVEMDDESLFKCEAQPISYVEGLHCDLFKFQQEGLGWMVQQEADFKFGGGILADEMGMGKTIQTISLLLYNKFSSTEANQTVKEIEKNSYATLIVCPVGAVYQWKSELEKFAPSLKVLVYHGPNRSLEVNNFGSVDVVITNYNCLEVEYRKVADKTKVVCPNCGRKYLPKNLVIHLKYMCGQNARKTSAQAKQERKVISGVDFQNKTPTISNIYKEILVKAGRMDELEELNAVPWLGSKNSNGNRLKKIRTEATGVTDSEVLDAIDDYDTPLSENSSDAVFFDSESSALEYSDVSDSEIVDSAKAESKVVEQNLNNLTMKQLSYYIEVFGINVTSTGKKKPLKVDCVKALMAYMEEYMNVTKTKVIRPDEEIDLSSSPLHIYPWRRIVLDEAHRIKNLTNNTSRSAMALKCVGTKWCLTGTPLQNRIEELHALLRFLEYYPYGYYFCNRPKCGCMLSDHVFNEKSACLACHHTRINHYSFFTKTITKPIINHGSIGAGYTALVTLRNQVISRLMLRRTKVERVEDIKLPPLIIKIDKRKLSAPEMDFYTAIYAKTQVEFNCFVEKGTVLHNFAHIFDLLSRLRQSVNHPYLIIHSDLNQRQLPSKKLIEFAFKREGIQCVTYTGSLTVDARRSMINEFILNKNINVICISLKAGGEGLNLQVASQIFIMDPWWNPASELQAIQRAHRIGQTRPVHAYRIIAEDTIEERILQLQEKKQLAFDGTIGNNNNSFQKLNADDIRFLFQ
uniref:DNA repair protein RAD16-like n=1 Tax=Dermatophagoides pteronyssinus TaxID=6956 RepID=A0A6P6YBK6_DERPT|nr:DNA repair protein RAD16-like [Dermatophagoides pteronyssinus]